MDKLKEVQKYQFWILLGVALILPLVGWSIASSGLAKEAEERTKTLDGLNKSLSVTPSDPNQNWRQGLDAINVDQGKQKALAWRALWERQEPLMVWPDKMPSDPLKITEGQQEYWRTFYRTLVTQVRLTVNPYDDDHPDGLVIYPEELLPAPDQEEWVRQAPSIKQIEASQEDLWLLHSILAAIASVNEGTPSVFDAPIREIETLYLRGGTPKGSGGAKSTSSGSVTGSSGGLGMKEYADMATKGSFGRGGMGNDGMSGMGGGAQPITPAQISPDDDLGSERAAASEKSASSTKSASTNSGSSLMSEMAGMASMSSMGGRSGSGLGGFGSGVKGQWSGSDKDRYRDNKDEWKTRGFHLEVTMDHRKVPELLVALANTAWPINVLRIQMSDYQDGDLVGGSGMPGGMSGGMQGGSMRSMSGPGMSGGMPGMGSRSSMSSGSSGRPMARGDSDEAGPGSLNNRSVLDDPNLAHVAIVGVIYIIKKPPEDKTATPAPPAQGTNPAAPPTAAPPTTPTVAAPAGEPAPAAASTEAAEAEKTEKSADEPAGDAGEKPAADADKNTNADPAKPKPDEPAPETR